jgi:aryl-alcohol dehydrogenase-like predicted oxidoreductase
MSALNHLKEQGKFRAIGVSNFSRAQLEEAAKYGRIDSLQPPYSLFWRYLEKDAMPYCIENKMTIIAYSPLAQGLLTGKFGPDHKFDPQDNRAKNKLFQGENFERAQIALEKLRPVAEHHRCTLDRCTLAQLAWLIAQPQSCAIAPCTSSRTSDCAELPLGQSQTPKQLLFNFLLKNFIKLMPLGVL